VRQFKAQERAMVEMIWGNYIMGVIAAFMGGFVLGVILEYQDQKKREDRL
jgi:uncharacterized membrane protein